MPADRRTDEEVIEAVLGGDRNAFAVLVDRHGARVHAAILRMIRDPAAADDLAQEALLKAYAKLGSFRRGAAFSTWLYAIAVNQVRSEFRRRGSAKGRPPLSLDVHGAGEDGERTGPPEPEARGPGPSEEAERTEEARLVHEALATIDGEYREAVVLRDLEGLSYEEIAGATGVRVGTVRSRIHRGRAALRERLLPTGDRAGEAR